MLSRYISCLYSKRNNPCPDGGRKCSHNVQPGDRVLTACSEQSVCAIRKNRARPSYNDREIRYVDDSPAKVFSVVNETRPCLAKIKKKVNHGKESWKSFNSYVLPPLRHYGNLCDFSNNRPQNIKNGQVSTCLDVFRLDLYCDYFICSRLVRRSLSPRFGRSPIVRFLRWNRFSGNATADGRQSHIHYRGISIHECFVVAIVVQNCVWRKCPPVKARARAYRRARICDDMPFSGVGQTPFLKPNNVPDGGTCLPSRHFQKDFSGAFVYFYKKRNFK